MRFKQFLAEAITRKDLQMLERYADRLFAAVGIDVAFTKHFFDRVNDRRNKEPIKFYELSDLFKKTYAKYGQKIANMGADAEAVLNDMATDINVPFVLTWDARNKELDLVSKTIMRKKNFKTRNQKLRL